LQVTLSAAANVTANFAIDFVVNQPPVANAGADQNRQRRIEGCPRR
jgi:hypothetical protein